MASSAYEKIPVPGYSEGPVYTSPEILYSYAGFTQKGVTIGKDQGILPAGTVLGRRTSDKKYYVYSNGASDGTETARGVLRRGVDTAGEDQLSNIVIQGILKLNQVSGADAAALTDLGAVTDSVRGTFKF